MESTRVWYVVTLGFHDLNLQNNLRVLRQLKYLHPLYIRHGDLVAQDMYRVED